MFELIKRWQIRMTTDHSLRFTNRVILSFENLETRTLLSSGVFQVVTLDNPMSAVALVAEPVSMNATTAQSQQGLSDVVGSQGSSKVLSAPYEQPEPTVRTALSDPLGLRTVRQMERSLTGLMNLEMSLLNSMMVNNSMMVDGQASQALNTPGLDTNTSSTTTTQSDASAMRVTASSSVQPVSDLQGIPNSGLNSIQLLLLLNSLTTTTTTNTNTPMLVNQGTANLGTSGSNLNMDVGIPRDIRAPVQTGSSSNGFSGPRALNTSPSNGTLNTPASGTTTPIVFTTDPPAVNTGAVQAGRLLQSSTAAPLPGQGTTGGTFVGGQILLPGVITTPPTPSQQLQLGILNTADPYAKFEQTILTKEGFKTASGEENPVLPPKVQQGPVRAVGTFEEEEILDLLDATNDQASLHRHKSDAFFADASLLGEDTSWGSSNSVALAGAMLILGGFWGIQVKQNEERRRRQSIFTTVRKWFRR